MRRLMASVAVVACLFASSCSRSGAPSEITVQIVAAAANGGAYAPKTVRARPGAVVTWAARDTRLHTVSAADAAFTSDYLHRGDSFTLRFNQPGTYSYFCTLHHGMTGLVLIE
jgi:plastocyanin